jgi:hypothetical protein
MLDNGEMARGLSKGSMSRSLSCNVSVYLSGYRNQPQAQGQLAITTQLLLATSAKLDAETARSALSRGGSYLAK